MKIDLNKPVIGLDGKEIPNTNLGHLVAPSLANTNLGDAQKMIDWAMALQEGVVLNLDPEEFSFFKNFVVNHAGFSNLIECRILENIIPNQV